MALEDMLPTSPTTMAPAAIFSEIEGLEWLLQCSLFFILFYLYLWLYVDLKLIYHGAGIITDFPVFYKTWSFFLQFPSHPGGPVEYLSAFLSQFFYYSWAGALIMTVQAWLMCLCLEYVLRAANLLRIHFVCFAFPILLLVLYTQYAYHFVTTMALLTALLAVTIHRLAEIYFPDLRREALLAGGIAGLSPPLLLYSQQGEAEE